MFYSRLLRKFVTQSSKLFLIAILWLGGVYAFDAINNNHILPLQVRTTVSADGPINVWWPTQNAKIADTQTFKSMVQDKKTSDYTMTWSVDSGQDNQMNDSSSDYPHKEAVVDLKGWTWHGTGPYKITFKAADTKGVSLGQATIDIYKPDQAQGPTVIEGATSTNPSSSNQSALSSFIPAAAEQLTSAIAGAISPNQAQAASVSSTTTATSTNPSSSNQSSGGGTPRSNASGANTLSVWWPSQNATVSGTQPFKARIDNLPSDNYKMFWQVDKGQLNLMGNNDVGAPHKETSVDLSGWNWHGTGTYTVTFIAKDTQDQLINTSDVKIYVSHGDQSNQNSNQTTNSTNNTNNNSNQNSSQDNTLAASIPALTQNPAPVIVQIKDQQNSQNPFNGQRLYVNPNNDAQRTVNEWQSSRPQDAYQLEKIAGMPEVEWLGNWNSDISSYVRDTTSKIKSQGALPVYVAYNIPARDCGQYSAGGINNPDGYKNWISSIANAIGNDKAVVILEPDALTLTNCLSQDQLQTRYDLINSAVTTLKSKPNIAVYIDAGHPNWISADDMAQRLQKAGVGQANGFSLNISNFYTTDENVNYGQQISNKLGGKHFIVDTSRNGLGPTPDQQWCNPWGRALGERPTTSTGRAYVDAFLWVKGPGGSDGNCSGGPNAGVWWPDYALDLARHAAY